MAMRTLLLVVWLVAFSAHGAIYWNPWTTNFPGRPVKGNNNISITNVSSGNEWRFYGSASETVARLGDIPASGSSQPASAVLTNLANNAANTVTNAGAGNSGIAVAIVNGTLWVTNLWSTNGFVTATITNGLATVAYVNTATNGFVGQSITNGLATIAYVNTATNGFVDASITNGLATIVYVQSLTNGFVDQRITNGLATVVYVNNATGNLAQVVQPASANLTNWSTISTNSYVRSTNGAVRGLTNSSTADTLGLTTLYGGLTVAGGNINASNNIFSIGSISALDTLIFGTEIDDQNGNTIIDLSNGHTVLLGSNILDLAEANTGNGISITQTQLFMQKPIGTVISPSLAVVTDANGVLTNGSTTVTELNLLSGQTSLAYQPTNGTLSQWATTPTNTYVTKTNGNARGLTVNNATASRAAAFDANGVLTNGTPTVTELNLLSGQTTLAYQPTNNTLTQWGTAPTNTYVTKTNGNARGLTIDNAAASTVAIYDANGVLTNGAVSSTELALLDNQTTMAFQPTNDVLTKLAGNAGNTVTNVSGTGSTVASTATGLLTINTGQQWDGCSGNFNIGTSQTIWWPLNNTKTNQNGSDVSGGTRTIMTRGGTLTNLYVVLSGAPGANQSNHFGIFTNGVATTIAVMISGNAATTGNDTTHSATVVAGDQVGIKIISSGSVTARAAEWALERR